MRNLLSILFISLLVITACSNNKTVKRVAVAKVGGAVLYRDDIPDLLSHTATSSADSMAIYSAYVNDWVRRELMFQSANSSLDYQLRLDIENQIRNTRQNLIIYRYEQQMMAAEMDTIVRDSELEEYYTKHLQSFTLRSDIVKAYCVKLSLNNSATVEIRNTLRNNREEDEALLNQLCYDNAISYDNFNNEWTTFDAVKSDLPTQITNNANFLRQNSFYETTDTAFRYLVRISSYILTGDTAPFEYVSNDVKRIILNNRRIDFIQKLENEVYNNALSNNTFTIY